MNMNHDEFYIWDASAFPNPAEFTPQSVDEIDPIVAKITAHDALKENKKFIKMAKLVEKTLKGKHDFDDELDEVFQHIVQQVKYQIEDKGYTYVALEKPSCNSGDYHLLFYRICKKVGLIFADFIPEASPNPVAYLPSGETIPDGLGDMLEDYGEAIKHIQTPKGKLSTKKNDVVKLCRPLFLKKLSKYGFEEGPLPNRGCGTAIYFFKKTGLGMLTCKLGLRRLSFGYDLDYVLEYHIDKVDEIRSSVGLLCDGIGPVETDSAYLFYKGFIIDSPKEIPTIVEKCISDIKPLKDVESFMDIERIQIGYEGEQPDVKKSVQLYLNIDLADPLKVIIICWLAKNPAYEKLKSKLVYQQQFGIDLMEKEQKEKMLSDWNKIVQRLDEL